MFVLPLVIRLISLLLVQIGSQVNALNKTQSIKHFERIKFVNRDAFDWKSVFNNSLNQPTSLEPNTAYLTVRSQQLHIDLISLQKYFSMILFPSVQFPVLTLRSNRSEHFNVTCYTGYLKNSPFDSQLFAYFHNQILNAIIFAFNEIYHLDELDNQTVIMYKESDLNLSDYKFFDLKTQLSSSNKPDSNVDKHSVDKQANELLVFSKRKLFNFDSNKETLYPDQRSICDVELLSDHTFTQYYDHDIVRISSELFLMLMKANSIYTRTDFNMDGRAGDVSLQLARIVIFHTENEKGYTWSDVNLDPEQVLNQFGLRLQTHCIAISLLNRDYEWFSKRPGTLGIGWIPKPDSVAFGICSRPVLNQRVSSNQLFIGSNHDDAKEVRNEYGDCGKNYLMSEFDSSTLNVSTKEELSYCSLKQIDLVLKSKSTCFRPYVPVCGNGIKEIGEECDCGPAITCSIIDPCCRPDCLLKAECKYSRLNRIDNNSQVNRPLFDKPSNEFNGFPVLNYPPPYQPYPLPYLKPFVNKPYFKSQPFQPVQQPLIPSRLLIQPHIIHPIIQNLFGSRKYPLLVWQPLMPTKLYPIHESNLNKMRYYPRLINEKLDRPNIKSDQKPDVANDNVNSILKDEGSKERNESTNLLPVNKGEGKILGFGRLLVLIPIGFVIFFVIVPRCCSQQQVKDERRRRRRKARRRLDRYTSY